MKTRKRFFDETRGSVQVEQLTLVALVAIGFASACVPLGLLLLDYCRGIEFVLSLPIP